MFERNVPTSSTRNNRTMRLLSSTIHPLPSATRPDFILVFFFLRWKHEMFHEARGKYHSPERSHKTYPRRIQEVFLGRYGYLESGVSPSSTHPKFWTTNSSVQSASTGFLLLWKNCRTPFSKMERLAYWSEIASEEYRSRYVRCKWICLNQRLVYQSTCGCIGRFRTTVRAIGAASSSGETRAKLCEVT